MTKSSLSLRLLTLIVALTALSNLSASTITYTPLSSTTVSPGGTIQFQVYGTTSLTMGSFSLFLKSSGADNMMNVTLANLGSQFTYSFGAPSLPSPLSINQQTVDLGLADSTSSLPGGSPYLLTTLTITFAPGITPGVYSINNTATTVLTNADFSSLDYATVNSFNVTVIPEPSTYALMLMGLGMMLLAAKYSKLPRLQSIRKNNLSIGADPDSNLRAKL